MERRNAWLSYTEAEEKELEQVAKAYRNFLNVGKTERECVTQIIREARAAGYESLEEKTAKGEKLKAGDKVYTVGMKKIIALFHIGQDDISEGMNILGAHIDSPRLDVKQNPLYEDTDLAYLDTHYYGGVKKYQWVTLPLAIHGVVVKKDGSTAEVNIGEDEDDPIVYITDLLIHLAGKQLQKKAAEVHNCKVQTRNFSGFSIEELAALCVGYGPGIPFAAAGDLSKPSTILDENGTPLTTNSHPVGYAGYVSPAIEEKGIKSVFYKDGPAGIGETAWPTEMLIACAFDKKLWYEFGNAIGEECERKQVDIWLAPAVNLHRNPLCGRNFEYFSEDPYLTGICACEITKGVQENHPVLVCPKHFAVNEQETFRRGSSRKNYDAVDSILTERTAREIYLKPFEMLELLVRIEKVLERTGRAKKVLTVRNILVDMQSHQVYKDGLPVSLKPMEYDLFVLLLQNKNIALGREELLKRVWGENYLGESRTVDVHIGQLRKKLELYDEIRTIPKLGYRLEE